MAAVRDSYVDTIVIDTYFPEQNTRTATKAFLTFHLASLKHGGQNVNGRIGYM